MAYSFSGRVRYSEIGENGRLTLPGILNYFQDCSTFQSEEVGLGLEVLKNRKRFWVLSAWQVIVDRYPALGEKIRTSTWAYGFRGFIGMRNFTMDTIIQRGPDGHRETSFSERMIFRQAAIRGTGGKHEHKNRNYGIRKSGTGC